MKLGSSWWKEVLRESEREGKKEGIERLVLVRENGEIQDQFLNEKLKFLLPQVGIEDSSQVSKAFLIDNPNLLNAFEIARNQITEKHEDTSGLFRREDWKLCADKDQRKKYLDILNQKISKFRNEWNDGSQVFSFFFFLFCHRH